MKGLKPVLNEDIRGLCNKDTTSSEYLFGENLVESMREAKENYRISDSIINTTSRFGGGGGGGGRPKRGGSCF